MPITHTTVAGATAVTSQLKENLKIKLQESIESIESFLSKSLHITKGPSDIIQTQL